MKIIIPITPATLDLIEVLNDGVRPALQDEETFFVYKGKDEHADIITLDEGEKMTGLGTAIEIFHIGR